MTNTTPKMSSEEVDTLIELALHRAREAAVGMQRKFGSRMDACGFASVTIKPARGPLVKALKARDIGSKKEWGGGGWWVSSNYMMDYYGQSISVKEAAAEAFAKVLREAGFNVYAESRLD